MTNLNQSHHQYIDSFLYSMILINDLKIIVYKLGNLSLENFCYSFCRRRGISSRKDLGTRSCISGTGTYYSNLVLTFLIRMNNH